jgi:hypothetical protein
MLEGYNSNNQLREKEREKERERKRERMLEGHNVMLEGQNS